MNLKFSNFILHKLKVYGMGAFLWNIIWFNDQDEHNYFCYLLFDIKHHLKLKNEFNKISEKHEMNLDNT